MPNRAMMPPMGLPDYGLGPMTDRSRRGLMPAEIRAYNPSVGEQVQDRLRDAIPNHLLANRLAPVAGAVMDYGPLPAQSFIGQAQEAGRAVQGAVSDPSIGSISNAGLQTGLAFVPVTPHALIPAFGSLGAGYALAAAGDAASAFMGEANADEGQIQSLDAQIEGLQKQFERAAKAGQNASGASRRNAATQQMDSIGAQITALREQRGALAKIMAEQQANESRLQREKEAAEAAAALQMRTQQTNAAYARANKAGDRDTRFDDSWLKDVYEQTGGPLPLAAGAALGTGVFGRLAGGASPVNALGRPISRNFSDIVEGSLAAFTVNNAPIAYDALMSPTLNPEYERASILAQELPDGEDKEKYRIIAEQLAARGDKDNPVKEEAWKNLTDTEGLVKRGLMSVAEGSAAMLGSRLPDAGATIARGAVRAPGRVIETLAEIPGQARAGYYRGQQNAQTELNKLNALRSTPSGGPTQPPSSPPTPPSTPSGGPTQPPAASQGVPPTQPPTPPPRQPRSGGPRQNPLGKKEMDDVLQRVASGNTSGFNPQQQQYANYLNQLTGGDTAQLSNMAKLTANKVKRGAWAVPATIGAGAAGSSMSFDDALADYRQFVIDTDGDGIPDASALLRAPMSLIPALR